MQRSSGIPCANRITFVGKSEAYGRSPLEENPCQKGDLAPKYTGVTPRRAGVLVELRSADDDDPFSGLLILRSDLGDHVELLGGLRNLDPRILSRTRKVEFRGKTLNVVGPEDFVEMKHLAGGPHDLLDARSVCQSAPGPAHLELLSIVTCRFGREAADRLEEGVAG